MAKEYTQKRLEMIPKSTVLSSSVKKCSRCIYTISHCPRKRNARSASHRVVSAWVYHPTSGSTQKQR